MKTFKIFDFWTSAILIVTCTIGSIILRDERAIYSYFIVGGWQVTSMLVHALNDWFCEKGNARAQYHRAILAIACTLLACYSIAQFFPMIFIVALVILFILLIASPFMAIYYTIMCHQEVKIRMQRPLAQLK